EALRAFSKLAQRLDEELAVAPSAELRALENDVLLQSPALDWLPSRPGPDRGGLRPATVRFVSRQREMRVILDAFAQVRDGDRRAVVVSGNGGIGKTTLVGEACHRARSQGAIVFTGQCDEDRIVDVLPIIEIVRAIDDHFDADSRATCADELAL